MVVDVLPSGGFSPVERSKVLVVCLELRLAEHRVAVEPWR